jgi:hypothetical protein
MGAKLTILCGAPCAQSVTCDASVMRMMTRCGVGESKQGALLYSCESSYGEIVVLAAAAVVAVVVDSVLKGRLQSALAGDEHVAAVSYYCVAPISQWQALGICVW